MIKISIIGAAKIDADLRRITAEIKGVLKDPTPLQDIIADTVLVMMGMECDPDGVPWPPLSPGYDAWKQTVAPGAPMGYLDGIMKDRPNLMGVATGMNDRIVVAYGVDPAAINHALKFQEGGIVTGTSQPPRPFYGLSSEAIRQLHDHIDTQMTI